MRTATGGWTLLEDTRRAGWHAMFLALALFAIVLPVANLADFGPVGGIAQDLERTTNGWVARQLVYPWITFGLVALSIFGVGGLRPADVGWRLRAVVPGLAVTALFWMSVQASLLLVVSCSGQDVKWGPWWTGRDGSVVGSVLDQFIGVALLEETFFRGFLLPQVHLQSSRFLRRWSSLVLALLVSSSLFVLSHVPRLLIEGHADQALRDEFAWIFPWGSMLALAFLVTRNLFVCVGLHALWNARPTLIEAPWETVKTVWWVLTTALLVVWWLGRIHRNRRFAKSGASGAAITSNETGCRALFARQPVEVTRS